MKSIPCWRKYVKSEKKGICCGKYIVFVNGKLAKNATMKPVLFLVLQLKKHQLYSCAGVDMSTPANKDYAGTAK